MNIHSNISIQPISKIIRDWNIKAALFDLDGTMVDNNPYHLKTWKKYLQSLGMSITHEEYNAKMNGRTNKDALENIFNRKLEKEELERRILEKEELYREIYAPFIKPVNGLIPMMAYLHSHKIKIAMSTSGIQPNIDFFFNHIPVKQYFEAVVNSSHITHDKPHPEIYLKTASILNIAPAHWVVFEDAVVGIKAGKEAGMKVIALSTTHDKKELQEADLIVTDFSDLFKETMQTVN